MRILNVLLAGSALVALSTPAYAWKTTTYEICDESVYGDPHYNILTPNMTLKDVVSGKVLSFPIHLTFGQCTTIHIRESGSCKRAVTISAWGLPTKGFAPGAAPGPFEIVADATHAPYLFDACHSLGMTVTGHDTLTYN